MENYGFIKLCYGVVGSYMDTSKMTVDEVVKEFLRHEGVSSAEEYHDKANKNTYGKLKQDILTKQNKDDIIKDKWNNGLPPRGHVQEKIEEDEVYNFVAKDLGISVEEATKYTDSILEFSDTEYRNIRHYQQGKVPDVVDGKNVKILSEHIEEYIQKAPRWNGGETFRGVSLSDESLRALMPGYEFDMEGSSSWTSVQTIAKEFVEKRVTPERPNPVVYHCKTQSKGTSIRHISVYEEENEVLCSKESKYKVISLKRDINNVTHIYLEEVNG